MSTQARRHLAPLIEQLDLRIATARAQQWPSAAVERLEAERQRCLRVMADLAHD